MGQIEVFRGFGRISWRGNTFALLLVTTTNTKILDILQDHRRRVIQLYEVAILVVKLLLSLRVLFNRPGVAGAVLQTAF